MSLRVLLTRPAHQADSLAEKIRHAGDTPVLLPTIEIIPCVDPAQIREQIGELETYSAIFFISPNAVTNFNRVIPGENWLQRSDLYAVGHATAEALRELGASHVHVPASGRYGSEQLLQLEQLQKLAGKVLIVRGEGGKALLGNELQKRGAQVVYAEVYRRTVPERDDAIFKSWTVDVITCTSLDALSNLVTIAGKEYREQVLSTPVIVISESLQSAAHKLGFTEIFLTNQVDEDAILASIEQFRIRHSKTNLRQ